MKHEVKSIGEASAKGFLKREGGKDFFFSFYWTPFVVSQSCQKDLLGDRARTLTSKFIATLLRASSYLRTNVHRPLSPASGNIKMYASGLESSGGR